MIKPDTFIPFAIFIFGFIYLTATSVRAQQEMPEIFDEGTLQEQLEFLQDRTRIYQDYRAIREDMFQQIKRNVLDSLVSARSEILELEQHVQGRDHRIDSLQAGLQSTNQSLEEAIKNRDSFSFLGIQVHKTLYNSIMWIIICALAVLTVILLLTARRNLQVTAKTKKDLEETRNEFEAYRKQARERQEQLVVKHHNELRKLKGN
jgi:hypothetical protein